MAYGNSDSGEVITAISFGFAVVYLNLGGRPFIYETVENFLSAHLKENIFIIENRPFVSYNMDGTL